MALRERQKVGAIFAPAVQPVFSTHVEAAEYRDRPFGESGWTVGDLNFLRRGANFDIGVFLTSAHVYRDVKKHDITHVRRAGQTHIVDSGGYSLINSTMKASSIARGLWNYQVAHGDIAMTLDVPTATITRGVNPHYRTFDACLAETLDLLRLYSDWNTSGDAGPARGRGTKWLNVLQGRNSYESQLWFEAVKGFGFDGWAFAGDTRRDLSVVITRLFDMFEAGLSPKGAWFHFLGMGSLRAFVVLTALRDGLRALTGDTTIEVSFDSAEPINCVHGYRAFYEMDDWRREDFGLKRLAIPNNLSSIGNHDFTGLKGPVLPWMTWNDLAYDPRGAAPGRRAELGGLKNDLLFHHHNVWSHVAAFADVGDELRLPRHERVLSVVLSGDYGLVSNLVASGSRAELARSVNPLARIRV